MKFIVSAILFASLFVADHEAKACGVKVITVRRAPKYREIHQTRLPKEVSEPRAVMAAPAKAEPVAAGPVQRPEEERTPTAQKPPEEPAPAPEPAPAAEPVPAPAPAPIKAEEPVAAKLPKNFHGEVQFRPNSAELTPRAKKQVKADAAWLKARPGARVVVEGHSDPAGPNDYNMELSERRAAAVRDALVEGGVDASAIEVTAFGEDKPAYKSPGRNRRAALKVEDSTVVDKGESKR
jgi:outer membrane protein OmpA-like peptidoglycan-associated protein